MTWPPVPVRLDIPGHGNRSVLPVSKLAGHGDYWFTFDLTDDNMVCGYCGYVTRAVYGGECVAESARHRMTCPRKSEVWLREPEPDEYGNRKAHARVQVAQRPDGSVWMRFEALTGGEHTSTTAVALSADEAAELVKALTDGLNTESE